MHGETVKFRIVFIFAFGILASLKVLKAFIVKFVNTVV